MTAGVRLPIFAAPIRIVGIWIGVVAATAVEIEFSDAEGTPYFSGEILSVASSGGRVLAGWFRGTNDLARAGSPLAVGNLPAFIVQPSDSVRLFSASAASSIVLVYEEV